MPLERFPSVRFFLRDVAQLVERTVRDREVAGSSPVIPTIGICLLTLVGIIEDEKPALSAAEGSPVIPTSSILAPLIRPVKEFHSTGALLSIPHSMRTYRYLDLVTAAFVAVLLISNVASSAKIVDWHVSLFGLPLSFDAGTLLFPLSYIFDDILTEVYGYGRSRRVIWTGFAAMLLMSACLWIIGRLPGEAQWQQYAGDGAYQAILGGVASGAIVTASLVAYFCGEFSNSYVLAKLKVKTKGRYLWMRTIGSTLVGEGLDTTIFVVVACALGVFPWEIARSLIVANYLFKVGIEVLLTPATYAVVRFLKRAENEDYYDRDTTFHPFLFS